MDPKAASPAGLDATRPSSSQPHVVTLRLEHISKTEARISQYILWFFSLVIIVNAIVHIALGPQTNAKGPGPYQEENALISSITISGAMLVILLITGFVLAKRVRHVQRERHLWCQRRERLVMDACVLLAASITFLAPYIAGLALTLVPSCSFPIDTTNVAGFFRSSATVFIFAWMAVSIRECQIAKDRVDQVDPRSILVMDQPIQYRLRKGMPVLLGWIVLEGAIVVGFALRMSPNIDHLNPPPYNPKSDCPPAEYDCTPEVFMLVVMVIFAVVLLLFCLLYVVGLYKASRDQHQLSHAHYKLSQMYVKVHRRYSSVIVLAMFFGGFVVQASETGTCRGIITFQLGSSSLAFAVAIYAFSSAALFIPSTVEGKDIDEEKEEFVWTDEEAKQRSSDVFCMETAVKMIYWSRLAYRNPNIEIPDTPNPAVSLFDKPYALGMFSPPLTDLQSISEPLSDTWSIVANGDGIIVVAFRGTASTANIWTDLKAWSTPYAGIRADRAVLEALGLDGLGLERLNPLPHDGAAEMSQWSPDGAAKGKHSTNDKKLQSVRCHSGFLNAWLTAGFNRRVLDAVKLAASAATDPTKRLQIYCTGHSLGGALAALASVEIAQMLPDAHVSLYTFGAPRVGSKTYAKLLAKLVPDSWAVVTLHDPIAKIPKGIYKRAGQRVVLMTNIADMVISPSFFEMTLFGSVGGKASHHKTSTYCMGLALFIKAQWVKSKEVKGGNEGAAALAAKVDLEETLHVTPLRDASLTDGEMKVYARPMPLITVGTKKSTVEEEENTNIVRAERKRRRWTWWLYGRWNKSSEKDLVDDIRKPEPLKAEDKVSVDGNNDELPV